MNEQSVPGMVGIKSAVRNAEATIGTAFHIWARERARTFPRSIVSPEEPSRAIRNFCAGYVQLPLALVDLMFCRANQAALLLVDQIAQNYTACIKEHPGLLHTLLLPGYRSLRLVEEMIEILLATGEPFRPTTATRSTASDYAARQLEELAWAGHELMLCNLVAHHLIGDQIANEIDCSVAELATQLRMTAGDWPASQDLPMLIALARKTKALRKASGLNLQVGTMRIE